MGRKCSVKGCRTGYDSQVSPGPIKIYMFPKEGERLHRWLSCLPNRLTSDKVTPHMGICALHWPEGIDYIRRRKYLIPAVPPSLFPNVPPSCIPTAATIQPRNTKKALSEARSIQKDEMDGKLTKVERGTPKLTKDSVPTLFTSLPEGAPLKRKESKASLGNAAKDGPGNIGEMDQQPFQDRMDTDKILDFSDFCRELKEKKKDDTWMAKLYENDRHSYYSFYRFKDLPDSKPLLSSAIRIFSDMKVEVYVNLNTSSCLDPVPNNSLEWLFGNRSCPILSAWVQFDSLLSHFSTIIDIYSVDDVQVKEELTSNPETDKAADEDNDDSDELNNSIEKEVFAERLAVQDSYKNSIGNIYSGNDFHLKLKEELTGNSETDMAADDDNDDNDELNNSTDKELFSEGFVVQTSYQKGKEKVVGQPPCINACDEEKQSSCGAPMGNKDRNDESERKQSLNNYSMREDSDANHFEREKSSNSDEMQHVGDADQSDWKQKFSRDRIADIVDVEQQESMQISNSDESKSTTASDDRDSTPPCGNFTKEEEPAVDDAQTDVKKPSEDSSLPNISLPSIRHDQTSPLSDFPPKEGCLQTLTTQGISEKQENSGSSDQFGCQFCRKVFAHSNAREIHMKIYHKDQYFLPIAKGEMNQSESGQQRQKSFTCDICKNSFKSKSWLTRHTNSKKCHLGVTKEHLHVNVSTHHSPHHSSKNKSYICDVCGYIGKDKHRLILHQRTHTGEKPYTCDICNRSFSQLSGMKSHMKIHNKVESVESHKKRKVYTRSAPPRERGTVEKKFMCELCGEAFGHQNGLILHQLKHTGKKPYSCNICGREFYSKYYVKLHKIIHTGKSSFQCSYCNRAFQNSHVLKIHARRHTGERPYKCEDCNRAFFSRTDYNTHRETHSGLRPYTCEICNKSFKTKRNYWPHKRRHTNERRFQCEICSKVFKDKSALRTHAKIHLRAQEQL